MKFITLNAIDLAAERRASETSAPVTYAQLPAPGDETRFTQLEYDDLERPLPMTVPVYSTYIAVAHIREFYGRKHGRTGTRIVFQNGAATVVKETPDEVHAALLRFAN